MLCLEADPDWSNILTDKRNGENMVEDLKQVFKQAAEIAQQVPENMQEAAFNRALNLLTDKAAE
jgi:hypothetical protein